MHSGFSTKHRKQPGVLWKVSSKLTDRWEKEEWHFSLGLGGGFFIYEDLNCIVIEEMSFLFYSFILVSYYNICMRVCVCVYITLLNFPFKKPQQNKTKKHSDKAKAISNLQVM